MTHSAEQAGIQIAVTDPATGDSDSATIWDDYLIITAGSAELTEVQVYRKADGTVTHVITVKGVRRG